LRTLARARLPSRLWREKGIDREEAETTTAECEKKVKREGVKRGHHINKDKPEDKIIDPEAKNLVEKRDQRHATTLPERARSASHTKLPR
jgi:hypothetical protein